MADQSTFYGMARDPRSAETRAQQLDQALNWIHENIATHLDVAALAQPSNMTASTMYRHSWLPVE